MTVAVVGSGPSGVAAAWSLLEVGREVELLDVGHEPEAWSRDLAAEIREGCECGQAPDRSLMGRLKRGPETATAAGVLAGLQTLLGGDVGAERVAKRILGSTYTFAGIEEGIPIENAAVPRSLALGGLSNVWGASCYPLRVEDYREWPIGPADLEPHFGPAADLLGLVQHDDGLARAYPLLGPTQPELRRNVGSAVDGCIERWRESHERLAGRGLAVGRTRLAVRGPGGEGDACRGCGLCFYGCAFGSIFSGRRTMASLAERPGFSYRPARLVIDFEERGGEVIVRTRDTRTGALEVRSYESLFLAAGTLSSLRIAADSVGAHDHPAQLLDNDMYLLPGIATGWRVPADFRPPFTLGEGVIAVDPGLVAPHALHLQLYTFHEFFLAELGPLLASLPGRVQKPVWRVLNNLLVAYVYLNGRDSLVANARVLAGGADAPGHIRLEQRREPESRRVLRRLVRELWRSRRDLGFVPLRAFRKATPIGFSGHLAGTLPMRETPGVLESDSEGRLYGTEKVYTVDCAALPSLPAQNPTFTSMANAIRVVEAYAGCAATGSGSHREGPTGPEEERLRDEL